MKGRKIQKPRNIKGLVNPFKNLNSYDVRKTLPVIRAVKSCDQRRPKNVTNYEKVSIFTLKLEQTN